MLDFLALASGGSAPSGVDTADFTFNTYTNAEPLRQTDNPVGDITLEGGITINRIRWDGATFTINRSGAGKWSDWVVGRGTWSVIMSFGANVVTLAVSGRSGVGGGFIRWNPSAAQQAQIDSLSPTDMVRMQVQP